MHSAPWTKTSSSVSGTFLADLGDFVQREFARQDDARDANFFQNFTAAQLTVLACTERWIAARASVSRTIIDQAGVGHDQRVGLEGDHRRHVVEVGGELGVVRDRCC
jgi:hypothetical protein